MVRSKADNRRTWERLAASYDRFADQQTKEAEKKYWQGRAEDARRHALTYKD